MHDLALQLALIGVAGIAAQWLAWRVQVPAIILLLGVGLLFGPITGFMNPREDFGDLYTPLVSTAVAIILFEGGMTLNFRDIRETSTAVRRMVIIGGPLVWVMTALAGHYIGNLSWPTAIILGAILVVTGPTVITPLLRHAKLKNRPASILRWEAIVNDPIGALFAVIAFETYLVLNAGHEAENLILNVILAIIIAIPGGFLAGRFLSWVFARGEAPEYLKAPILLVAVVGMNSLTNLVLEEGGLLTVTVMGITMANTRIASLSDLRRFKETITLLLVSGLFIILTASLQREVLASLEWRVIGFLAAVLFVVRPVAVFVSTLGAGLTWRERLLVGWIAPRGIVAVAISGLFALRLDRLGYGDGSILVTLSFAVVIATILFHGFSIKAVARLLKVTGASEQGLLIVGATPFSLGLADQLRQIDIPVTIADNSWQRLAPARQKGIPTYHGEILSEATEERLDLAQFQVLAAATGNEAYNALVCNEFAPEIGRDNVYQLGDASDDDDPRTLPESLRGRTLFTSGHGVEDIVEREEQGWTFRKTKISEQFDYEAARAALPPEGDMLLLVRRTGALRFFSHASRPTPQPGDTILSYVPPAPIRSKGKEE